MTLPLPTTLRLDSTTVEGRSESIAGEKALAGNEQK